MSRVDKLKRLKDEVGRLFYEGLDVNAVVDQLRTDEQFAEISFEQVKAFYSYLQEKVDTEVRDKHQIVEKNRQIMDHQQKIATYEKQITTVNQKAMEKRIARHERIIEKHQQMKTELQFMVKNKQNLNKFLIHDESFVNRIVCVNFWQGRFFMTVEFTTGNFYKIKVQDLFQGATKSFTIRELDALFGIYALKFPFVLFHEFDSFNDVSYFRLLKFNFESESSEVVQSFEFNSFRQVLVNALDVSKFLLQRKNNVNECNLIRGQIQIGKKLALEPNFNFCSCSYFGNQLCILKFRVSSDNQSRNYQLTQVKMLSYDLERNEYLTQDVDSTPKNIVCFHPNRSNYSAWIRDTVFVTIEFSLTGKHGVIFTNPQMRNWKFVKFATNFKINHIQSFADGALMVCTEGQRKREIYKLQMRKPDFLRNMAWTAIVKLLKEAKIEKLYEEARQYLPLNSEIQPFVFTED